jgi:hypothetical protein
LGKGGDVSVLAQAADESSNSVDDWHLLWLVVYSFVVLLVFAGIYVWGRFKYKTGFNITFARIYALVIVATLGVGLAFADVIGDAQTAAFTLLGIIAGYLAGAKPAESTIHVPGQENEPGETITESVI